MYQHMLKEKKHHVGRGRFPINLLTTSYGEWMSPQEGPVP